MEVMSEGFPDLVVPSAYSEIAISPHAVFQFGYHADPFHTNTLSVSVS
jgi:hypothetical protein